MYCSSCRTDVDATSGYCSRCGMALNARLCPNGHVMDPSWNECKYCPPGAGTPAGAQPGTKGRTLLESGPSATPQPPAGGFVKGATLLEDGGGAPGGGAPIAGRGRTVAEGGVGKGRTVADAPPRGGKARTVFDPGTSSPASGEATRAVAKPKLVGWLVTYSLDPSGTDYTVREGRNVIGADAESCDVAIKNASSVSSRHAVLMYRDGRFQVRDNDSTNGTYLNGSDIFGQGAVEVNDHDHIKVGEVELLLVII